MASWLHDPHPEVELAPPMPVYPLAEPRLRSPTCDSDEHPILRRPSTLRYPTTPGGSVCSATVPRPRPESYNFTGSTFLITSTGQTLKLPVPSQSPSDPLNWSWWKTSGAMFALALFSVVCLTAAQAASVVLEGIQAEFADQVR
jgi:hypothetical protein